MSPPDTADHDPAPRITPTTRSLFLAFLRVGISGFGGVMPFAHRMLRRYHSEDAEAK